MNIYVNGVKQGGGGAVLPDTPAAVLLDAATPNSVVVLDGVGAGTTGTAEQIVETGIVETCNAAYTPATAPSGSSLIYDAVGDTVSVCSETVAALLASTALPFTSVIDAKEHITNNGNSHDLLSVNCGTANRGYILRFTVGASNATTWQAGVAWDIIAAVTHDGAVTIRNSVITKSDPASPWTVTLSTAGNNVKLSVTGAAGTPVAWFAGGFLTIYDGVM